MIVKVRFPAGVKGISHFSEAFKVALRPTHRQWQKVWRLPLIYILRSDMPICLHYVQNEKLKFILYTNLFKYVYDPLSAEIKPNEACINISLYFKSFVIQKKCTIAKSMHFFITSADFGIIVIFKELTPKFLWKVKQER
jgi:hypothetical protein